ncbi:ethylbenzene dehydrogenase-related protein [Arcobacter sp. FWKO B]|uniref:ethylbenzene dehydrogenase-related protein n=1 Tax=Arcobacter sp. FWKO B TaxID=2593672 RepID=UPI0018A3A5AF|nr:ethylbenzene dehydrogenase-related protein [Arcobacter sp. FWKO B]QOG12407.1 c-type cytochrome [Arcobacter sp. FWKO B]
MMQNSTNSVKKLVMSSLTAGAICATSAFASPVITAYKVDGDIKNIGVESSFWRKAKETEIIAYPQTTIHLNDKKANELNDGNKAKKIKVKALTDGQNIAFKMEWADKTESIQSGNAIKNTEFADGFAVQFAAKYDDPLKLPYIGMGSEGRPVMVYLQKAVAKLFEPNGNGDVAKQVNRANSPYFQKDLERFDIDVAHLARKSYQKGFVAEGFGSMTEIKDKSSEFLMDMKYKKKIFGASGWEGSVVRPLNDNYVKIYNDPIPVAFAVWDGDKMHRDGLKHLSTWIIVEFDGVQSDDKLKKEFDKPLDNADLKNGAELTKMHCASCHNYGNVNDAASAYMAPNLSNIGGYSTTPYLIESILEPHNVIVPGYNPNAHSNFAWYYGDKESGKTSAMPAFDYLSEQEVLDIVGYLKTLKAEVE